MNEINSVANISIISIINVSLLYVNNINFRRYYLYTITFAIAIFSFTYNDANNANNASFYYFLSLTLANSKYYPIYGTAQLFIE